MQIRYTFSWFYIGMYVYIYIILLTSHNCFQVKVVNRQMACIFPLCGGSYPHAGISYQLGYMYKVVSHFYLYVPIGVGIKRENIKLDHHVPYVIEVITVQDPRPTTRSCQLDHQLNHFLMPKCRRISFPMEDSDPFILHSQHHGRWCPNNARSKSYWLSFR